MRERIQDRLDFTTEFGVLLAMCLVAVAIVFLALIVIASQPQQKQSKDAIIIYDKPATKVIVDGALV